MKFVVIYLLFCSVLFCDQKVTIEYFEERSKTETIEQVSSKSFKPLEKLNFGFASPPIWLKITHKNDTNIRVKKIFEFQDNRLDRVEIYQDNILKSTIGDMLPFNNREIKNPSAAYAMFVDANSEAVYFIRVVNRGSMNLRYMLYEESDYKQKIGFQYAFFAFYFGAALIMILYNLILFFFIKEMIFFTYVVYHTALIIVMLYFDGILLLYLMPDSLNQNFGNVPIYFSAFTVLIATQFARDYLRTSQLPRVDKYILFLMSLNLISIYLSIFDLFYVLNNLFSSVVMIVESLLLFCVSIYLIIVKKSESAKFYFLGWGVMLLAVVIISLITLGIVSRTVLTSNFFQIASLFELLLLSMGLAFRYNLQHRLIAQQKQDLYIINKNLEATILERTEKLHKEVKQTKSLLKDREILFKELYHRVKNNLQMMVSILSMQKRRVEGSYAKGLIEDITGRIKSLALIHEKLQVSDELDNINMREYLTTLLDGIKNSYAVKGLELRIEVDDISMNIDQVTSIGLIVNELANNSFKHAFTNTESPCVSLKMSKETQTYHLTYSDNGEGNMKIKESKSLGSTLIKTLTTSQLKGSYTINAEPSVTYSFKFPL